MRKLMSWPFGYEYSIINGAVLGLVIASVILTVDLIRQLTGL